MHNTFHGLSVPEIRQRIMDDAATRVTRIGSDTFDETYHQVLEESAVTLAQHHWSEQGYVTGGPQDLRDVVMHHDGSLGIAYECVNNGVLTQFGPLDQNPGKGPYDGVLRLGHSEGAVVQFQHKVRSLPFSGLPRRSGALTAFPQLRVTRARQDNLLNMLGIIAHPNDWDGTIRLAALTSRDLWPLASASAQTVGRVTVGYSGPEARSGMAGFVANRFVTPTEAFLRVEQLITEQFLTD